MRACACTSGSPKDETKEAKESRKKWAKYEKELTALERKRAKQAMTTTRATTLFFGARGVVPLSPTDSAAEQATQLWKILKTTHAKDMKAQKKQYDTVFNEESKVRKEANNLQATAERLRKSFQAGDTGQKGATAEMSKLDNDIRRTQQNIHSLFFKQSRFDRYEVKVQQAEAKIQQLQSAYDVEAARANQVELANNVDRTNLTEAEDFRNGNRKTWNDLKRKVDASRLAVSGAEKAELERSIQLQAANLKQGVFRCFVQGCREALNRVLLSIGVQRIQI